MRIICNDRPIHGLLHAVPTRPHCRHASERHHQHRCQVVPEQLPVHRHLTQHACHHCFVLATCRQPGIDSYYYCYDTSNGTSLDQYANETSCVTAGFEWTNDQSFTAPWTQTLLMFLGLCVLGLGSRRCECIVVQVKR